MSANDKPRFITALWRNLKRSLSSSLSVHNGEPTRYDCDLSPVSINANNFGNDCEREPLLMSENHSENAIKRQRLNLAINQVGLLEESSFMEIMKNLLSCSICLDVNNYSNQCSNGHLICLTCSGKLQQSTGDLNCPVCRVSLKQGLHRSLLAEQLTSELPAACRHCDKVMAVKLVKKHETDDCPKRMVPCQYKLFGCTWIGRDESCFEHVELCSIALETVGTLHHNVTENINKDFRQLQGPLQLWRNIISKLRVQAVGSRIMIRQTTLNRISGNEQREIVFKSPMIRVPFSCCSVHGFYLEVIVSKNNELDSEKLHYVLKSENRTKITLNYCIVSIKVDESINLDVQDLLHYHPFESSHKETVNHEFKLISLDCDKGVPSLSDFENIFVELCLISERERSERGHGILSNSEEEESNGFISTSASDSNVMFTLFSPTASSSRSMNTSNITLAHNDDANQMNEIEPSHEDNIVITVTENVDSGDELPMENRDHYTSRNNHSYVAVPSLFLNQSPAAFVYSSSQLENGSMNNNFQQPIAQYYETVSRQLTYEQEANSLQTGNLNRTTRPIEPLINQDNRTIQLSLFYPTQTIMSPYLSNPLSHLAIRPLVVPRTVLGQNSNQTIMRTPRLDNVNEEDQGSTEFQILFNDPSINEVISLPTVDNERSQSFTYSRSLEDLNMQHIEGEQ